MNYKRMECGHIHPVHTEVLCIIHQLNIVLRIQWTRDKYGNCIAEHPLVPCMKCHNANFSEVVRTEV